VIANESTQVQRVIQRDCASEAEARKRMAAQLNFAEKATKADLVILNDGSLDQLIKQANATLSEVCRRANIDEFRFRRA